MLATSLLGKCQSIAYLQICRGHNGGMPDFATERHRLEVGTDDLCAPMKMFAGRHIALDFFVAQWRPGIKRDCLFCFCFCFY